MEERAATEKQGALIAVAGLSAATHSRAPAAAPASRRLRLLGRALAVGVVLLAGALGRAQLLNADEARALDRRQTLRRVMVPAPRGAILDRHGRVLAETRETTVEGDQPGVGRIPWTRHYPHGATAAHVLGRVRRETVRTPAGEEYPILNYATLVGDWGVEKHDEARLAGTPGYRVVRVDAQGQPVGAPLEQDEPVRGGDVVLSLDLDVQRAAERALDAVAGGPRGGAVAIAVATGEVLALVSKPDFDLNEVSPCVSRDVYARIEAEGGWLNRATQGLYPPGSSFKVFTALAALRADRLPAENEVNCVGHHDLAGRRFRCHNAEGHGPVGLTSGLARSCNVFAYRAGLAAGPEALAAEARRFRFDRPAGLDLPFETTRMLVPDPAWKRSAERGEWTPVDTAQLAIGQGALRYSPLQAAAAMAALARRETFTVPTLRHAPGRAPTGDEPPEPLGLTERDYAALVRALRAVVETGIGRRAQVPGVAIAGKTGTAQIARPEGMMNVAWFVAFAPAERPEIAVAVALEGGEPGVEFAGAEHAAPVGREIIAAYLDARR